MGDTHHDPTDHSRTTQPHAGIAMKDNFFWPGLILLAVAVFGTDQHGGSRRLPTLRVARHDGAHRRARNGRWSAMARRGASPCDPHR